MRDRMKVLYQELNNLREEHLSLGRLHTKVLMEHADLLEAQLRLEEDYDELRERHRNKKERFVLQLEEKNEVYEVVVREMKKMKEKEKKMKNAIEWYKTKLDERKKEIDHVTIKNKDRITRIQKTHLEYVANLKKTYQEREEKLLSRTIAFK